MTAVDDLKFVFLQLSFCQAHGNHFYTGESMSKIKFYHVT